MPSENNISKNKRYFQKQLDSWTNTIAQNLNHLSKPQAVILAMMSLGMIAAQSCALSAISAKLAISLKIKHDNIRQSHTNTFVPCSSSSFLFFFNYLRF